MTTEARAAIRESTPTPLAFLKIDRAGSAEEWKELPEQRVFERRRRFITLVEAIARGFGAVEPFNWQGDGVMLFFQDGDEAATLLAVRAARQLWEQTLGDFLVRMAVHAGTVPWNDDTGKLAHPAIDACGHLEHDTPDGTVAVTEDVFLVLPSSLRTGFEPLGVTVRDGTPAFAFPRGGAALLDRAKFREDGDLDLWQLVRRYTACAEISRLRYAGSRLQKKEPPSLDIREVFISPTLAVRARNQRMRLDELSDPDQTTSVAVLHSDDSGPDEMATTRDLFRLSRAIVVLGEPGSGKSTLVRWLALTAAGGRLTLERELGVSERLLPLPLSVGRLAEIRQKSADISVVQAIAEYFDSRNFGNARLAALIERELEAGNALVLLDGLDEIVSSERESVRAWLVTFASRFHRSRFVITSRIVGYPGLGLPSAVEATVRPFDSRARRLYLNAFCVAYHRWKTPDDNPKGGLAEAKELDESLERDPRLGALGGNPFLLTGLALIEGKLPRHRIQAYELLSRSLCEAWESARRLVPGQGPATGIDYEEEALPILGDLALAMHRGYPSGVAPEEFVISTLAKALQERKAVSDATLAAKSFLERAAERAPILVERGAGQWGFLHLTFQEFFAAAGLHARDEFEEVALRNLFDPRWREVTRLGVGYMALVQKRPKATADFVERVFKYHIEGKRSWITDALQKQLVLAALAATEAGEAIPAPLRTAIAREFARWTSGVTGPVASSLAAEMAQTSLTEELADIAARALGDQDADKREWAGWFLAHLRARSKLVELTKALDDPVTKVSSVAAGALGALRDPRALEDLFERIGKLNVPWAIAQYGREMVEERLLSLIKPWGPSSSGACRALGWLKSEVALEPLGRILRDEPGNRADEAAWALGRIGGPRALGMALQHVEHASPEVRAGVAGSLGSLGGPPCEGALLGLLEDVDERVRVSVLESLGRLNLGLERLLEIARLPEPHDATRRALVWALGQFSDKRARRFVLSALETAEFNVNTAALRVLEGDPSEEARMAVRPLLEVDNHFIVQPAAETIGFIGSEEDVPALLDARRRVYFEHGIYGALYRISERLTWPEPRT